VPREREADARAALAGLEGEGEGAA
jgi:hypothetical protein